MSLILVKDNANSKIRELECDSNGFLKVEKVDVSALARADQLESIDLKIVACDTGNTEVSSCALPPDAATGTEQSNQTGHLFNIDDATQAIQMSAESADMSLTNIDSNTSGIQSAVESADTHLSDLSACVVDGVLQTSASGGGDIYATSDWVFGDATLTEDIPDLSSAVSASFDADNYRSVMIAGTSNNTMDSEIQVQVSNDDILWFDLNDVYINVDYVSGDFGKEVPVSARYIRCKRENTSGSTENIRAFISGKKA